MVPSLMDDPIEVMMMHRSRNFLIILMAACMLMLSGCVTLTQEITVREDGSGSLRFDLGVETDLYPQFQSSIPDGFQLNNLLATLIQNENVILIALDNYEANGYTWESIQLEITDFVVVFEQGRRIGPMTLAFTGSGSNYNFVQSIDVANSTLSIPGVNLMDLSGARYTVRLITPQIIGTNGVQQAAEISTWSVPLSELLQNGEQVNLRAEYSLEAYEGVFIPWDILYPYVVIGFLSIGGIAILSVILINTVARREKPEQISF